MRVGFGFLFSNWGVGSAYFSFFILFCFIFKGWDGAFFLDIVHGSFFFPGFWLLELLGMGGGGVYCKKITKKG